jgi:7-cyano-7-deazaguanine reductase
MAVTVDQFRALGKDARTFEGLDTFPCPTGVQEVTLTSDEVTALCPVTGQPDWYTVAITYAPRERCIESKSLKLYLQSFRDQGIFAEAFAARIANDVADATAPTTCRVIVKQKARGGITIEATAVVDAVE